MNQAAGRSGPSLRTPRLLLRRWCDADRAPFAALNADPVVMEHFPAPLTRAASDALVDRAEAHFAAHGFGWWAVQLASAEVGDPSAFVGFVGLNRPRFEAHFVPCVEIGWRLASRWHRRGFATEAARACLDLAFSTLGLDEVVSFTAAVNLPSRGVMEKLGMRRDADGDFDHPSLPAGHRLARHVLYRIRES